MERCDQGHLRSVQPGTLVPSSLHTRWGSVPVCLSMSVCEKEAHNPLKGIKAECFRRGRARLGLRIREA